MVGWHKDTITVRTLGGETRSPAWRRGEFAIHGRIEDDGSISSDYWRISHVPSGFAFPGFYTEQMQALDAAEQIALLRDDWSKLDPSRVGDEFKRAAMEIITQCGAEFGVRTPDQIAEMRKCGATAFANNLNGYANG